MKLKVRAGAALRRCSRCEPVRRLNCAIARDASSTICDARGAEPIAGVAADFCARWAVEGLLARNFNPFVSAGLMRGIARQIEAVARAE